MHIDTLKSHLQIGDIVFIHIDILPFRKIAKDTKSWTNHVGIVIDVSGEEPLIAESTFPFSKATPFTTFIKRSKEYRAEIKRLEPPLHSQQQEKIQSAAKKRMGIFYDTGFNLHSPRQFCSRYVYEVVRESLGIELGKVESLESLFADNPLADVAFWRLWYFGSIPWQRKTVTPASVLNSPELRSIFDGHVTLK